MDTKIESIIQHIGLLDRCKCDICQEEKRLLELELDGID